MTPKNPCVIKMSSALEATLRGIASPIKQENAAPKPADRAAKKNAPVLNLSFFRAKHDEGKAPQFRKQKRDEDEKTKEIEQSAYIEMLERRLSVDDDISFVEDVAKKFGITVPSEQNRERIRALNELAKTEPQIEFILK